MFNRTNYSNLIHLQVNVDTILFSNRQFDSLFDTIHTVIGVTRAQAWLKAPKRNLCIEILKLRELSLFYTGKKFTFYSTQQHYFTKNGKKEK